MGILNLTPDSFSDGAQLGSELAGRFFVERDRVLRRAEAMVAEGATILDVGGESTRPGAAPVSTDEELNRVLPVIEVLTDRLDVCLSVDSSSPEVIAASLDAGASLINDVRALAHPEALARVAASKAAVCLMHMQGQPGTMQQAPRYEDVLAEVLDFLRQRVEACEQAGIERDRILVDPGFGFGKSLADNYCLLQRLDRLSELGLPLLVGLSRKSMLGKVTGRPVDERLSAGVAAATLAMQRGARILRSHDVSATMDAIKIFNAFRSAARAN